MRPNGLRIQRVRVPLGVVAIIYENRPNVTSDAAGLCVKSGNAAFLRGSSGAIDSNIAIAAVLREGMAKAGLPEDAVVLVEDTSREAAVEFMRQRGSIDCLIPRGGPSLIQSILDNATVPYVIDGDGNCHVYVARGRRPRHGARDHRERQDPAPVGVQRGRDAGRARRGGRRPSCPEPPRPWSGSSWSATSGPGPLLADAGEATEDDWANEFLDLKLAVRVVDDLDEAIAHITRYGSGHSEAIVTDSMAAADRFCQEVDAAAVLVNASTRFVDGEEFGFGAEIGISTQKLHARGPMGLRELTTAKYVVRGEGQTRP